MTVSVIIPTYNRATLLCRAIDSVVSQTRPALEIIVVDDGSTDATASLIQEQFPQLVYLRQSNAGVAAARNRGIEQAKGDWLAFLDSDDAWLAYKLERQLQDLERRPGATIAYSNEIWIRHGRRVNPKKRHAKAGGYIFQRCLPLCIISPSSVIIHQRVFERVGLFDESLPACEDYDLWLRICAHYPVRYLDESLIVKYAGHPDQLSQRYWGMDRFRIQALEKLLHNPMLNREYRLAALQMLVKKLAIYGNGVGKRGRLGELARCERKRDYYVRRLAQLKDDMLTAGIWS